MRIRRGSNRREYIRGITEGVRSYCVVSEVGGSCSRACEAKCLIIISYQGIFSIVEHLQCYVLPLLGYHDDVLERSNGTTQNLRSL
jgi:hypothetical protein